MTPLEAIHDRNGFGVALTSMGLRGTGVEVGVYIGEFSNNILRSWPGILIGVDSYNNGTEFDILLNAINKNNRFIQESRYKILVCDSRTGANYTPSELDFVYIDAGHTYEEVTSDILSWWPKIKRGGVLSGHDYDRPTPGVCRAVDEFTLAIGLNVLVKPCGSWFTVKP